MRKVTGRELDNRGQSHTYASAVGNYRVQETARLRGVFILNIRRSRSGSDSAHCLYVSRAESTTMLSQTIMSAAFPVCFPTS